ncbi:hypothetical protein BZG36_05640 [Bifiguratus adelaidae]|uniref:Transferase n=1 Tax=Bifiguratus adelaidae TaxID=1938954 RepID=A0A261XTB8_9FUNG|nr:hypothetical protein BZG36_05640 [Bifiguratus adelaidae]
MATPPGLTPFDSPLPQGENFPLFGVQFTLFANQAASLAVSLHHYVSDVQRLFDLIHSWSQLHRGVSIGMPLLDCSWLVPPPNPSFHHPEYTVAAPLSPNTPSTVDSKHLLFRPRRVITRARGVAKDVSVKCGMAFNEQSALLGSAAEKSYMGNVNMYALFDATAGDIVQSPIASLAQKSRQAV